MMELVLVGVASPGRRQRWEWKSRLLPVNQRRLLSQFRGRHTILSPSEAVSPKIENTHPLGFQCFAPVPSCTLPCQMARHPHCPNTETLTQRLTNRTLSPVFHPYANPKLVPETQSTRSPLHRLTPNPERLSLGCVMGPSPDGQFTPPHQIMSSTVKSHAHSISGPVPPPSQN